MITVCCATASVVADFYYFSFCGLMMSVCLVSGVCLTGEERKEGERRENYSRL